MKNKRHAIVIGAGPNGLAAAIVWAQAGGSVTVYEGEAEVGGGARTAELTLPGFWHDVCSAVHPMAASTAFFASLPLERYGLEWIHPPLALAHPLDDGSVVVVERSGEKTAERLGEDEGNYRRLIAPVVKDWKIIEAEAFRPLHWPGHKLALARFGLRAIRPARTLAEKIFTTVQGRALFAGIAAHAGVPLEAPGSAAMGLILTAAAHRGGWPIARGGSRAITQAMAAHLQELGGEIQTGHRVGALTDVAAAAAIFCDVAAPAMVELGGAKMPGRVAAELRRFRRGPGVVKLDWALNAPIPWTAAEAVAAGTVHVGGTLNEIAASEGRSCAFDRPQTSEQPFVLLSQPSLFDPSRAPEGKHTAWAYCHVPNGYAPPDGGEEMAARIEAQVERFAPGFRATILARSVRLPREMEQHNPNLLGGDVGGGRNSLRQLVFRPSRRGYGTGIPGVYLCSASTPPGGGVHGLCGAQAARRALDELGG
ncbi:MAG: phytoene desaturase family protein [Terriglobales bacterium]